MVVIDGYVLTGAGRSLCCLGCKSVSFYTYYDWQIKHSLDCPKIFEYNEISCKLCNGTRIAELRGNKVPCWNELIHEDLKKS